MVLLLNFIPLLLLLVFILWGQVRYSKKKDGKSLILPMISFLLLMIVYTTIKPSYLPKGEIVRKKIPSFEQRELDVKDVVPKPLSGEERDSRRKEMYKEKLPFIENNELTPSSE